MAGFAPRTSSATLHHSDRGAAVPPSSGGSSSLNHSASMNARNDRAKDSGIVTDRVAGSYTGGVLSPSANHSATGPAPSPAPPARMPPPRPHPGSPTPPPPTPPLPSR